MDVYLTSVSRVPLSGPCNVEPGRAEGSFDGRLPNFCIPRASFRSL
jgi:hypothetical protein